MRYTPLLLLAALFGACSSGKPLNISFVPKGGETLKMRQSINSRVSMNIMEQEQEQSSENISDYEYKVIEKKPDGVLRMEVRITRMQMTESNIQGVESHYDSADPNADTTEIRNRMFRHIIGEPTYMSIAPNGKVLEYMGLSNLMDKMFAEAGPEVAPMLQGFKNSFSDSTMMETMGAIWQFTPNKPVKVGKKWKSTFIQKGQMGLKHDITYKLKSRNEKEAIIESNSVIGPPPGGAPVLDMKVMKVSYDLKGTAQGLIFLSQPDGLLQENKVKSTLSGIMTMTGGMVGNMKVPITINLTSMTRKVE